MSTRFKVSGLAAGLLLALAATTTAQAVPLLGLTTTNRLVSFDSANPLFGSPEIAITGLTGNERLLGIDLRPSTGVLYGISSANNLYTLNASTGAASFVAMLSTALAGASFGIDFNPVPDNTATGPNSLRLVSDTGQNLRVQVNPAGGTSAVGNAIVDASLNGATTRLDGVAYSNNDRDPATGTTLYGIDAESNALYSFISPNAGSTQLVGGLGGPGFDVTAVLGFDIAGASTAFAALVLGGSGDAKTGIYSIDLGTGAATLLGAYGIGGFSAGASQLQGLTVAAPVPEPETYALMLAGLGALGFMSRRKKRRNP